MKLLLKITASILSVTILIGLLPMSIMAEQLTSQYEPAQNQNDQVDQDEYVKEIIEKRTEYSKTFERGDGTYSTIISKDSVHFKENGQWIDIDNSLIPLSKSEQGMLTNHKNEMNVEIPQQLSTGEQVCVSKGPYRVEMKLLNKINSVPAHLGNTAPTARAVADQKLDDQMKADEKTSLIDFQNTNQSTDIRFQLTPNSLQESIVLYEKPLVSVRYDYEINANGLKPHLAEDNKIEFYSDETDEPVFMMPSPTMYDSSALTKHSVDMQVELNLQDNGTYQLSYTPSMEWFSDDLNYPVTISSSIITKIEAPDIDDSYVSKNTPNTSPEANGTYYAKQTTITNCDMLTEFNTFF